MHQCYYGGVINMTYLALHFSHYVNGVAMRHGDISRQIFGDYAIDAITNGVHAATWASPAFAALFDHRVPGWRRGNFSLRYAVSIPRLEVWETHVTAKLRLIELVNHVQSPPFDPSVLTIGFARRAAAYKRAAPLPARCTHLQTVYRHAGRTPTDNPRLRKLLATKAPWER